MPPNAGTLATPRITPRTVLHLVPNPAPAPDLRTPPSWQPVPEGGGPLFLEWLENKDVLLDHLLVNDEVTMQNMLLQLEGTRKPPPRPAPSRLASVRDGAEGGPPRPAAAEGSGSEEEEEAGERSEGEEGGGAPAAPPPRLRVHHHSPSEGGDTESEEEEEEGGAEEGGGEAPQSAPKEAPPPGAGRRSAAAPPAPMAAAPEEDEMPPSLDGLGPSMPRAAARPPKPPSGRTHRRRRHRSRPSAVGSVADWLSSEDADDDDDRASLRSTPAVAAAAGAPRKPPPSEAAGAGPAPVSKGLAAEEEQMERQALLRQLDVLRLKFKQSIIPVDIEQQHLPVVKGRGRPGRPAGPCGRWSWSATWRSSNGRATWPCTRRRAHPPGWVWARRRPHKLGLAAILVVTEFVIARFLGLDMGRFMKWHYSCVCYRAADGGNPAKGAAHRLSFFILFCLPLCFCVQCFFPVWFSLKSSSDDLHTIKIKDKLATLNRLLFCTTHSQRVVDEGM